MLRGLVVTAGAWLLLGWAAGCGSNEPGPRLANPGDPKATNFKAPANTGGDVPPQKKVAVN